MHATLGAIKLRAWAAWWNLANAPKLAPVKVILPLLVTRKGSSSCRPRRSYLAGNESKTWSLFALVSITASCAHTIALARFTQPPSPAMQTSYCIWSRLRHCRTQTGRHMLHTCLSGHLVAADLDVCHVAAPSWVRVATCQTYPRPSKMLLACSDIRISGSCTAYRQYGSSSCHVGLGPRPFGSDMC